MAEASKQIMDLRFATTKEREAVVGMVVEAAQRRSVRLTPPELSSSPVRFQRDEGTSVFRPKHSARYSSTAILDAEARLLDRANATTAPMVRTGTVTRVLRRRDGLSCGLSTEQRQAVQSVATSALVVDLLVGAAGAGKTTTMRALHAAWVLEHGRGSVVGLAPSAAAAQVLGDDLDIECENTAKWLHEYDHGRTELRPNQLVILDEATLADTGTLDRITAIAARAGAKVLLVGDPYQLSSVDAGGAFALLVDRRPDAPELVELHRFTHDWEKRASLALRRGDAEVVTTYARHHRIYDGRSEEMLDAGYQAWRADSSAGWRSILVTESAHAVRELNERARADRLLSEGSTSGHEIGLVDGTRASVGDIVLTRRNDRTLRTSARNWVKNGDRWRITDIRRDGSVVVERLDPRSAGSTVLPAEYVAEYLDLGYAITAHRAQGVTVDTSHVVVTASTSRENFYVAMTRGRDANTAYVVLDQPDDSHSAAKPDDINARTVLYGILHRTGASLSAHQTIEAEYERHGSIGRISAELETIAADAQRDRFSDLLRRSGLTEAQHTAAVDSSAFGPLAAALRCAEAYHHDLETLVPRIVRQHGLDDAADIAAVLLSRLAQLAATSPRGCRQRPRFIAGLLPEPLGPMSHEDRQAIAARIQLIETRADALVEKAISSGAVWLRRLGEPPASTYDLGAWKADIATVAAYRDRYTVTSDLPTGGAAQSDAQGADRRRALQAARRAAGRPPTQPMRSVVAAEVQAIPMP